MKLEVVNIQTNQPITSASGNLADILTLLSSNRPFLSYPELWRVTINEKFVVVSSSWEADSRLVATNIHLINTETGSGPITLDQAILTTENHAAEMFNDPEAHRLMAVLRDIDRELNRLDESCHHTIQRYGSKPTCSTEGIADITRLQRDCLLIEALLVRVFREVTSQTSHPGVLAAAEDLRRHISEGVGCYSGALNSFLRAYHSTVGEFSALPEEEHEPSTGCLCAKCTADCEHSDGEEDEGDDDEGRCPICGRLD